MTYAVHIIHPYTYKLEGDTFVAGPSEKDHARDSQVAAFVGRALESSAQVIHHRNKSSRFLDGILQDTMFQYDPLFDFLRDQRLSSVVTSPFGIPLPDEKPAGCTDELWKAAQEVYSSHSQFQRELKERSACILIGGVLEACVSNFALYYHQHYRQEGEGIVYIPALCVSFNTMTKREREKALQGVSIKPLSYQRALQMLSTS